MRLILVGFGTVGQSLAALIQERGAMLQARYGVEFSVVGVATGSRGMITNQSGLQIRPLLDAAQQGSLTHYPEEEGLQRDFAGAEQLMRTIAADAMVEVSPTNLQTAQPALGYMQAALQSGKHVVTANKGPIALAYDDLRALADENGCQLRFESTVMAGTPAIATGRELLAGANIRAIRAILNGTTNYMLTQMEAGMSYEAALAEAQRLGYAETDPTADVDGWDVAGKLLILLAGIMERPMQLEQVTVSGIRDITAQQIADARAEGMRYKLIGTITAEGAIVQPECLPMSDPLVSVNGVSNAITYETDVIGSVTVQGPGAGGPETAFGLLADLLAIARNN